jgi:lysophospholipase L1-like esterase
MNSRVVSGILLSLLLAIVAIPLRAEPDDKTRLEMLIGGRTLRVTRDDREAWAYQWPSVYFAARFQGEGVTFAFDDSANNFNVFVDGRNVALLRKPGTNSFAFKNLGSGEHTVRVEKRSETQYAVGAFKGFFVADKANALPAAKTERAIEFIGDSLTVGYGNTSASTQCTPEELFEATDAQQAFGPLVAKHYAATYQVNAFSGLGMVRNFDGREHPKYRMPMLYPRALFDDPTPDDTPWEPQIIVIGIGGNDFSSPIRADEPWGTEEKLVADFEKTYVAFMKDLRAKNPRALLLMTWTSDRGAAYPKSAQRVLEKLRAAGVKRVDSLVYPKLERTGCDGQPNLHDDELIAGLLEAYIDARPDIWLWK